MSAELAEKYRVLAELRERREELERQGRAGFGEEEGRARRDAFRALAARFPGALRELDTSPAALLRAKERAVRAALAAGGPAPAWIAIVVDFHETLRDALAAKLWLARRIGRDGAVTEEHARALGRSVAELERLRHPPGGRVLALVWAALEARHGRPRAELEEAVFGAGMLGR